MSTAASMSGGAVHSSVRRWLRLEGLIALIGATYLYERRLRTSSIVRSNVCRVILPDVSAASSEEC